MSRENTQGVRRKVPVPELRRRAFADRLVVRFPSLSARLTQAVFRLPPDHLLRRLLLDWGISHGFAALNRRDHAAALVAWANDVETTWPREVLGLGFDRVSRGRDERFRVQRQWAAELGEHQQKEAEIIDVGDRLVVLARILGSGRASGAAFQNEVGYVFLFSKGRVVREDIFFSHREALEAVGLRE